MYFYFKNLMTDMYDVGKCDCDNSFVKICSCSVECSAISISQRLNGCDNRGKWEKLISVFKRWEAVNE